MKCDCEYHYRRSDGLADYVIGILTDEHASSSYGLPVFVASGRGYRLGAIPAGVYGPAELPPINGHLAGGLCLSGAPLPDRVDLLRRALAAGYVVAKG